MEGKALAELERWLQRLWEVARGMGLDPLPVHFEVVPANIIHEISAYGLPGRFSHWSSGKVYRSLKMRYDHGLMRIYELVVNADPAQAFLLENNAPITNKLVMAHVLAHADFFKNNLYFASVPRDMMERANIHAQRLREYELIHGKREVESFLDAVLSIQDHPDLLGFIMERSPVLQDWERDIIAMVRDERLYFLPQMRTKVINEGWAAFWHTRLMRAMGLDDAEYADFARLNAEILSPHGHVVNPYLLGSAIFQDVVDQLGDEEGYQQVFLMREVEDDVSFIRNHMNEDLVSRLDLFVYEFRSGSWVVSQKGWEDVRDALVDTLLNGGNPFVVAEDGDYGKRRELLLRHLYDGRELDQEYACKTLQHITRLWGRSVHLETVVDGKLQTLSCQPQVPL